MRKRTPNLSSRGEASLSDILSDPITQALMRADGVTAEEIRVIVADVRQALGIAPAYGRVPHALLLSPRELVQVG